MAGFYSSVCKAVSGITMSESDEHASRDYLIKKAVNKKFPITKKTESLFKNITDTVNQLHSNKPIDEKTLNIIINKEINKYNKGNKKKLNPAKYRMMYKIHAMLSSNTLLLQSFIDQYSNEVLNTRGIKLTKQEVKDGIHIIPLDRISTNMMQSLYWDIHQTYNATQEKDFQGVVGNLRMMWSRPTKMARFDPTGGLMKTAVAARSFLGKVTAQVSSFLGTDVKRGMNWIFKDIESEVSKKDLSENAVARLKNLFIMNMQGWVNIKHSYIDSNGKEVIIPKEEFEGKTPDERKKLIDKLGIKTSFMINSKYGIDKDPKKNYDKKFYRYDEKKKHWVYRSTNDPVYDYSNPMTLNQYIKGDGLNDMAEKSRLKKELKEGIALNDEVRFILQVKEMMKDINLDQDEIINLEQYIIEARGLHSQVFQDLKLKFNNLDKKFKQEIYKWFPGARNDKTFREKILKATLEGDFSKLNKDDRDAAQYLYETFGKQVLVDPFMTGDTTILEKKDSFPIEYEKNHMFAMYEGLLPEIEQAIENTKDLIKTESDPKIKKKLIIKKFELESQRRKVLQNQAMFNDQEVDNYSEKNMYTKRDAKSFRHISNTFDIRNMKLTEDVYSNYLRRMYSTLERGNLSVETMGGSRVTGGGRTMKKNPVMVDYGINLMKTVLHKPDAKSNVFGYDFSTSKMYKHFFGKFKKLGITEYKLDKYVRTISAYITGRYLGRPDTAFLNRTVALNKMINYGWGDYQKARIAVQNHKKVINGFVAETGVTDWSDYFTRELLGDLTQTDVITRDESLKVVKAMLDFHIALKKGVKEPVAKKALIKTVSKLAKNTPAIKSMLENIPEERKLRDKQRADTENKLLHITNRWASWAITKEYSAYPMSQQDLTKLQWLSRFAGKGMEALNNAIMKLPGAKSFLTMSEVETQMRSESVVLAMIKLQETGQLKIDQLENIDFIAALELEESGKLTTDQLKLLKEDKELVKKVARDFVAQTDMQMTTSDVGMYNRAFGGLHTRFTIYIQQKYGHDVSLFKKYYRSLSSDDKKSPIGIRTKEMIKAMATFRKKEMDKLWKKNPDMVKLRNFILSSGLMTLFFDLILFVPGATQIMRNLPFLRNRTLVKFASGLTSDVVSLTTSLPLYLLFALMADEDEEEVQNEVYYKLRRLPFLGFGSGVILDQVFALFSMAMDINENEKARRMARAISPMLPLPPPSSYVLDPIARETIQGAIQD